MFLLKNLLELFASLLSILDRFFDRTGQYLDEMWEEFPRPVRMLDATIRYFTGLAGLVIEGLALQYFDLLAVSLEKRATGVKDTGMGKPYQHVMTPANAVRYVAYCIAQTLRFVSLTRDASLLEFVATKMGLWVWHLVKRFKLIVQILGFTSEAEVIAFFRSFMAGRVASALLLAVVAVIGFALILCCATVGMLAFAGTIIEPQGWKQFTLFSQHPRRKERIRISRRVGGVVP